MAEINNANRFSIETKGIYLMAKLDNEIIPFQRDLEIISKYDKPTVLRITIEVPYNNNEDLEKLINSNHDKTT